MTDTPAKLLQGGQPDYDLVVIGGGVNGCGIAMDAAGRGLKILLLEMNDLGSATSSSSSKLIHGGLRYLEFYEFRLVREALKERETLLSNAPHIIWPLRFRLPHRPHLRPAWMIRIGLFLYDHLARRKRLAGSHGIRFAAQGPLVEGIHRGFEYADGWVDDARLVVLCAMAAAQRGAIIQPRCQVIAAAREGNLWRVHYRDNNTGKQHSVISRTLVNAAGPWVSQVLQGPLAQTNPERIRMVKGSHLVVPRLYTGEEAYILQNDDGRIVFVIPYENDFSLIGTTDVDYHGDPSAVVISDEEIDYLLSVVNQHFRQPLSRDAIVWDFAGVRPLMDEAAQSAQKASRDYRFVIDAPVGQAALLSVFGGKITTYRKLAEAAMNSLCRQADLDGQAWTASARLPGGNFDTPTALLNELQQRYPWLDSALAQRYVRTYGTLCIGFLGQSRQIEDLGEHLGAGLYACEVTYLVQHEWAQTSEDILWRRTKLGLHQAQINLPALQRLITQLRTRDTQVTADNGV